MGDELNVDWFRMISERWGAPMVQQTRVPFPAGKLALELIERWGLVAAVNEGEDSSGRAMLRLQTPDELVARAFDVAEKAYVEMERRGWLFDVPAPLKDVKNNVA